MTSPRRTRVTLRLCALFAFLSYLFAGSSLALPTQSRCGRCAQFGAAGTMKPGTSCPLSLRGHDCYNAHKQTGGKITLCPDGCMHHDGQGGEIPSLAKFVSAPPASLPSRYAVDRAVNENQRLPREPFLSSPDHPPSASAL